MKQIKLFLAGLMVVTSLALFAQGPTPYLTFRLADPVILPGGANPDTLMFTVEVKCDTLNTYHTDLAVYLNYNTDAFGTNIVAAGGISIERAGLTSGELVPGFPYYNFLPAADNSSNIVAWGTEAAFGPPYSISTLNTVLLDYQPAFNVKMVILDNTEFAGITFQPPLMSGSQFYVLDPPAAIPSQYNENGFEDDLSGFPLFEIVLMLSEIADPETPDANAKFVEIYNPMADALDFSFVDIYLNKESNGGSSHDSIELTGTIAAGGTYVVAFDDVEFTTKYGFAPDLDGGFAASGNGDDSYTITSNGGFFTGTLMDIFGVIGVDGTDEPWEYTDTKAVRKYNIIVPNTTFTLNEWVIGPKGANPGSGTLVAYAADMTPKTHRATVTWDGSTSQAWRDKTNWTPEYIPDAAHNVVINTGPGAEIGETTYAYCNDLTVSGVTRAGAYLTILSSPTGDGSLVTFGTVSGNVDVEKYLPADRWNYVTPPVTGALAEVFIHTWMYTYDETTGDWGAFIVPETTPLDVFRGYADWTSSINKWSQYEPPLGDTTTMYNNLPLNYGPYNAGLIYASGTQGDGYNFMGNPYVASIDWEASTGWDKTGLASDGFVIWNGTMNATYVSGSGGTNGASQYIPPQQGFFVQTVPAGGTFGLDDDVKVHSEQAFLKDGQIFANRLSVKLIDGELSDETVIYFNENATAGKDYSYDADKSFAPKFDYNPDGTVIRHRNQIYTMAEGVKRAINTFNNIDETPVVEMGVLIAVEGELTINVSNIESFDPSTPIFLEDTKAEVIINLRESSTYTFTASPEDDARFKVHFADPLSIEDPANAEVYGIYSYNRDVYVNFTGDRGEIVIYNIMGQEVYRSVAAKGLNKITLTTGNAAYIVKVVSDNSIASEKVFIR